MNQKQIDAPIKFSSIRFFGHIKAILIYSPNTQLNTLRFMLYQKIDSDRGITFIANYETG